MQFNHSGIFVYIYFCFEVVFEVKKNTKNVLKGVNSIYQSPLQCSSHTYLFVKFKCKLQKTSSHRERAHVFIDAVDTTGILSK